MAEGGRVWDLRGGGGAESQALAGHQGEVKAVCSLSHEGLVFSAGSDRKVMVWSLKLEA